MSHTSISFRSDNDWGASPAILAAVAACNADTARPYGADPWTGRARQRLCEVFGREVEVLLLATGTAANSISLAAMSPRWGSIVCHRHAHVLADECGAPEFFTGGARLVPSASAGSKLDPACVRGELAIGKGDVHCVQPSAVSITQCTEDGNVYSPEEVAAVSAVCRESGALLHMDGARFANALVSIGCTPAELTWRAGVDVLSFGATKNGALGAEAVLFFDPARAADFEWRRKRAGHLLSKMRYVSAQLLAYLEDGLWLRNAARANALARRLGAAAGPLLRHPVEANEVFIKAGDSPIAQLRAAGFEFYDWGAEGSGEARFVVSWDQPEDDVAALERALAGIRRTPAG